MLVAVTIIENLNFTARFYYLIFYHPFCSTGYLQIDFENILWWRKTFEIDPGIDNVFVLSKNQKIIKYWSNSFTLFNGYNKTYHVSIEWKKRKPFSILKACSVQMWFYLLIWITCYLQELTMYNSSRGTMKFLYILLLIINHIIKSPCYY